MNKVVIKGISLFPFTSSESLIDYACATPGILVAVNAEKIINATDLTTRIINTNIGYCDGVGPLMMLRGKGQKNAIKIAGCELWLKIIEKLYKEKKFYLVGGTQKVIDATIAKLRQEYKGIKIVGYRNGYFSSDKERETLIADIARTKPDVVFVAMGAPRQEILMEEMQHHHKAIYQGLGGSFDVYTGNLKRAPKWWVNHGLEWLYRLLEQPSRIKRQIKLVKFMWWVLIRNY